MLLLLSPAKTLDFESPVPPAVLARATEPLFSDQAAALIQVLRKKSPRQVAALMDLSDALAALNVARYAAWQPQATPAHSKPALLAFDGDVYGGLQARTLKVTDLEWAQQHVVILSGLYGALRPLDRLQPYRLEMGTALSRKRGSPESLTPAGGGRRKAAALGALKTRRGKDLYAFWGGRVAAHLNERQADEAEPVILNLASIEYARVVRNKALRARVVDCVFEDVSAAGGHKVISFFAKKARGLMARHAIAQRASRPRQLEGFGAEGYALDRAASQPERLVFRRAAQPAPPLPVARGGLRPTDPAKIAGW